MSWSRCQKESQGLLLYMPYLLLYHVYIGIELSIYRGVYSYIGVLMIRLYNVYYHYYILFIRLELGQYLYMLTD